MEPVQTIGEVSQALDEINDEDNEQSTSVLADIYDKQRNGFFSRRLQSAAKLDSPKRPRPPGRAKLSGAISRASADRTEDNDESLLSHSISVPTNSPSEDRITVTNLPNNSPSSPVLQLPARPPPGTFKMKPTRTMASRLPVRSKPLASKTTSRPPVPKFAASSKSYEQEETLESELRRADESFGSDPVDEEREEHILSGIGSRSRKQGFLAHGGAGGHPVLMGPGYVEGLENAIESDDEIDESSQSQFLYHRNRSTSFSYRR